jgi:LuxR family transcriptional regulator, maltose regulon positive regulatory protein
MNEGVAASLIRTEDGKNDAFAGVEAPGGDGALRRVIVAPSVLSPPAARPGTVVRQALLDRLADSLSARMLLMIAPAGWGKTSLLRDWWLTSQDVGQEVGVAWLSVRESDNDPVRFWSGVVAALDTVAPGTGKAALEAMTGSAPRTPGLVEALLLDDLARLPRSTALVLDDFHLITSPEVRTGFGVLLEHLPPTLSLVVAGRSEVDLPVARLRARGELAEISADQLRFSEAEAEQLLNETLGLALAPEEIHALWQRTEGWAAGLYLAGLPLLNRKDNDPAGRIGAVTRDDRPIFDYLAAEVLAGLPPRLRTFLLRTAVLDQFCAPLCDIVTGAVGSQDLLEEIERRQLFLTPLDNARRWYRYHTMFAEALTYELERAEPGLAQLLYRRASNWHRQYGTAAEAISHAIDADDFSDARELISARWHELLDAGVDAITIDGWLDRLPSEMVVGDTRMCLKRAVLASFEGRPEDVEQWLAAAETATPQGPWDHSPASVESVVCFFRALHRWLCGDLAAAEPAARRAAELELESGNGYWRVRTLALLSTILFWRGQDADAGLLLEQLLRYPQRPVDKQARFLALSSMAAIATRQGDYESARSYAREAADLPVQGYTVIADVTSAYLLAEDGDLAAAETVAATALGHAAHRKWRLDTAAALLCLVRIYTLAGRAADARAHLEEASEIIANLPDPGALSGVLAEAGGSAVQPEPAAPTPRRRTRRPDGLTDREAEILSLLTRGHTNLEIAAKLVVSVHTVERHLQNSYRKIGVRNRADASAYMARDDMTRDA